MLLFVCWLWLAILQDRILVFHRGIGSAKVSGLLIDQKLDLLMDYTGVKNTQTLTVLVTLCLMAASHVSTDMRC